MRKPILTIFYPFNPWHSNKNRIQTIICSFIKYAPDNFEVRLVGIGKETSLTGVWQDTEFAGRSLKFMSLITLGSDEVLDTNSLATKYTAGLIGRNLASDFMHFHRLEPSLSAYRWLGHKTLFIHDDIQSEINPEHSKNTILWQTFPDAYFDLEKSIIDQFDRTYICYKRVLSFYQERYSQIANRFTHLQNAVDTEIFQGINSSQKTAKRQELVKNLNLSPETKFILFTDSIHRLEDLLLLIHSCATLTETSYHLLILGKEKLDPVIQAEINYLELSSRITLLGEVEQQKLAELYHASNVFVLINVNENLPVAVLEALSCGTPIVTTNCGETPKILSRDSGIVCQHRTPEAIGAALEQVLQDSDDYPPDSCISIVQPYAASNVVQKVYEEMWQDWVQRQDEGIGNYRYSA